MLLSSSHLGERSDGSTCKATVDVLSFWKCSYEREPSHTNGCLSWPTTVTVIVLLYAFSWFICITPLVPWSVQNNIGDTHNLWALICNTVQVLANKSVEKVLCTPDISWSDTTGHSLAWVQKPFSFTGAIRTGSLLCAKISLNHTIWMLESCSLKWRASYVDSYGFLFDHAYDHVRLHPSQNLSIAGTSNAIR